MASLAGRGALAIAGLGLGALLTRGVRKGRPAELRGAVALVTGGSRGLGLLIARELAAGGARLVICARDAAELERARADLAGRGADVLALPCDVADRDAVDGLVRQAIARFGRVDVLVNNASIIQVGPLRALTRAHFEDALAVNFWGVVNPTLAVLPGMLTRRRGHIVMITSIGGKVAVPHLLPYDAAKFAALGFSEGLAAEVDRDGVTVTTIVPGLMRTGSYLNALFEGRRRREFTWFSLGSTLPGLSMDAERAARQVVAALRRGDRERILSVPAMLLARFHGLFPATTIGILALVNRLLPSADGPAGATERGAVVQAQMRAPLLWALTRLGRAAARRFLEVA